ncbi:MAG: DUF4404 family protein [Planctomycetota bacterium]
MDPQPLQATLQKLHEELEGMEKVDDNTRAMLATLTSDIQRVLGESGNAGDESLADRVEEVVQEFGAEHPRLAAALNQVSSALANLGI